MKRSTFVAVLLQGPATVFGQLLSSRTVVEPRDCDAQDATEFALEYGEPLLSYERTFKGRLAIAEVNEMVTSTRLSSPQNTATVKPNYDTLYMSQCFDVGKQDLVFTIGSLSDDSDRFWSASFYTPYGDNYLNLGAALNGVGPGDYLVTPANASDTAGTLQESEDLSFKGVVYVTNTIGFLLVRIAVRDTEEDLARVQEIQRGFGTKLVDRPGPPTGPELSVSLFDNSTSASRAEHILELTSRFVETDPLWDQSEDSTLGRKFSDIGLSNDSALPQCVDLASASEAASDRIGAHLDASAVDAGNDWVLPPTNEIGMYDGNYTARAAIARWGFFAMTSDVALYPRLQGLLYLEPNESYTLDFSTKPPLKRSGFWSITMYDENGLLVENSINRYAIGDRSNLSYPDGSLVYGDSSSEREDANFQILVQQEEPPTHLLSNWLPSPKGDAEFELMLRFYIPEKQLIDMQWEYPELRKGAAVVATNNTDDNPPDHVVGSGARLSRQHDAVLSPLVGLLVFATLLVAV